MGYGTVIIQSLFSRLKGEGPAWLNLKAAPAAVVLFAPPFRGSDEFIEWTMNSSKLHDSMKKILEPRLGNGSQYLQQYWKDFRFVALDPTTFVFAYLSKSGILMKKSNKSRNFVDRGFGRGRRSCQRFIDRKHVGHSQVSGPSDQRFPSVAELISKKDQTRLILDDNALAYLINRPFEVNLCNKKQETALHIATQHENIPFVSTLPSSGNVLINSPDSEGMTALHRAVLSNKKNLAHIVQGLIKAGADR